MIDFQTNIIVSRDHTIEEVFLLFKDWLGDSPMYKISKQVSETTKMDSFSVDGLGERAEYVLIKEDQFEIAAVRMSTSENNINWIATFVAHRTEQRFIISILVEKESELVADRQPNTRKPYIVKLILSRLKLENDDISAISEKPTMISEENIQKVLGVINGHAANILPVVYVSIGDAGRHAVNYDSLALWLAGVAHVFVESDRKVSKLLRDQTEGENPYLGAIGVYWPQLKQNYKYLVPSNTSVDAFTRYISLEIQHLWSISRPIEKCRWTKVSEIRTQKRLDEIKSSGQTEISYYVDSYEEELRGKTNTIESYEAELFSLRNELQRLKSSHANVGTPILFLGSEEDIYTSEQHDLILDILRERLDQMPTEFKRRRDILQSILEKNQGVGTRNEILSGLKDALQHYKKMEHKIQSELEKWGFDISDDGKHYKIVLNGDDRYPFTLMKTSSDNRAGLNSFSDLKKLLF